MTTTSMRDTLRASGLVGADLLAVDWERTPVGDPDTWPLSLRNAIRILLTSRFSMWMAWGPELTFFCNDAYRRDTLGKKYPWALGRSASEVWSEIWPDIGPRIERVMSTGEATWDEALLLFLERSGYAEETYHTFSYSPLADDDGQIVGMLCVVSEVTEEVVATRRMTTLRDLGVRMSAAGDELAAVRAACTQLSANAHTLPFAGVYLFEEDGERAVLTGTAGIDPDHPAAPSVVTSGDDPPRWPLDRLWAGETVLEPLAGRFADLPTGAWELPPEQGVLVPLLQPAQDHPYGFLLVGLNPHRPFDEQYRDFVTLVAAHLSAAISDSRAIEAEKQRAETLARLDQAKTDFFANVSHELRTPLTLLLAPAEDALVSEEEPLPPHQRERLATIVRNGQRMLQLVNTLLDFSRLESGRARSEFRCTDLCTLTGELAAMFQSAADRSGLRLEVDCDGPVWAWVDHDQWAKVVLNLLSNAFKFTFEGAVRLTLEEQDGEVVLTVKDTGTGIPDSEMPHLFERFHRVAGARSRTHEGSGIGLALVAELVALHGGRIEVASRVGEGSTFTVRLPQGRDHLPADQVREGEAVAPQVEEGPASQLIAQALSWLPSDDVPILAEEPSPAAADGPPRARVLVVDDNADMRAYIADTIGGDCVVDLAADGVEALQCMQDVRPDLVITDVMMPRLDGFGLLERMQADPVLTAIPVIMLSARAGEEGMIEGLEAGADDYLVKPFSGRELMARVRVTLALDREQRVREVLERSEQLLDQAQRLARVGSWEINLDEDTLIASRVFLELLELTREELEERGAAAVIRSRVHPGDLKMVDARLADAQPGEIIEYETRIVLPSGSELVFEARGEVVPPGPDGARVLRGSFQDVTEQRATQQRLITAQAEREASVRERRIAEQLQASLLPASRFDVDQLEVAAVYRAGVEGTQVGGDWYDVLDLGAGRTALVVGDVMGRGVRAAAVMGQLKSAVRAFATLDLTPVEVLEHLDTLVQDLTGDQIVTCIYAVHDAAEQTLTYANAGHLPPLVRRADGRSIVVEGSEGTGPPLGAGFFGAEAATTDLDEGDVVLLYTDGLVERRGHDIQDGIDTLARMIDERRDVPLAELPNALVTALVGADADDDVALIAAQVAPDDGHVYEVRLSDAKTAPRDARRAVGEQLGRWEVDRDTVDDVVLATSELVTNALVHARPPIDLRLRAVAEHIVLEVQDRALLRPRRRRPEDDDERGRGLNIVEALSLEWGTHRTASGKTVWCSIAR
ncbi:MAG TPA: SpoIIE family protein phosphatase [Nocardioides sp.]|nr:SpoIIE family protein phosphatase [Nocardioides sp.]